MLQYRKVSTLLAIITAAAGVSAFAGSAQAAVIQNSWIFLTGDPAGEVSLTDGNVSYDWSHGTISPEVTGTMKVVNGDDANFRVRVDSLDIKNNVLGTTYYTPKPNGFKDDDEHEFAVDMAGTPAPNLTSVEIVLEKQSSDTWKEKTHWYQPVYTPKPDDVRILAAGIDVGGSSFDHAAHEPIDSAKVSWDIGDDGMLTATYDGFLHLEPKFFGAKARVQLRALNNAGKVLDTANGDAHSQTTPAYEADEDTVSVTTADATRVKVKIQTSTDDDAQGNPIWQDVTGAEQTVSVAE